MRKKESESKGEREEIERGRMERDGEREGKRWEKDG